MFEMTVNNRAFFWRVIASNNSKTNSKKMKLLHFMSLCYQNFGLMVLQPFGDEGFGEQFQG